MLVQILFPWEKQERYGIFKYENWFCFTCNRSHVDEVLNLAGNICTLELHKKWMKILAKKLLRSSRYISERTAHVEFFEDQEKAKRKINLQISRRYILAQQWNCYLPWGIQAQVKSIVSEKFDFSSSWILLVWWGRLNESTNNSMEKHAKRKIFIRSNKVII